MPELGTRYLVQIESQWYECGEMLDYSTILVIDSEGGEHTFDINEIEAEREDIG